MIPFCCRCLMPILIASTALGQISTNGSSTLLGGHDPLSVDEEVELRDLDAKRVHQLRGHADLARLLDLRRRAGNRAPFDPARRVVVYAEKSLGVAYRRHSHILGLAEADCVTWTERVLALALSDDWDSVYRLSIRMRFKDGDDAERNRNHYPLADWIVNNAWLLEDVTDQLQVETDPLDVYTNRRRMHLDHLDSRDKPYDFAAESQALGGLALAHQTTYVASSNLKNAVRRMHTGDILFFIANYPGAAGDVERPRCVHQAFLKIERGRPYLLHCVRPRAMKSGLYRFIETRFPQDRFLGAKVARLRPGALAAVQQELSNMALPAITADELDRRHRTAGVNADGTVFVRCTRAPDRVVTVGDVDYGVVDIAPGETLFALFRGRWKQVYDLPENLPFRQQFPDPDDITPGVGRVLYPLGKADPQ